MTFDYGELVQKQKNYFLTGKTRNLDLRIKRLKRLKFSIIKHTDEILEALKKDVGKSDFEAYTCEIMCTLDEINMAVKYLKTWAKPVKVKTPFLYMKADSRVYYEPFGTAFVISAWNYPFQLAMIPMIGAIAAGNCCIVKPSELSPNTSKMVALIIRECFKVEFCTAVEGGIEETTMLLQEKFDIIHYTGSTRVGRIIAQAAAKHLTPVVLEMGGKSPCIVDHTANIEVASRRIAWGKFLNAGQTCIAPDYLIVHHDVKKQLLDAIRKQIQRFYGGAPEKSSDYARILNERHFDRLSAFLTNGTVVTGGKSNREKLYIEPTVLDGITWDDPVMQEEIFGPILPVLEYENLNEVVQMVNEHDKPLALYLFSNDIRSQKKIIKEVPFGGGCINTTIMHTANPNLPFGGVGASGMGNYHGKWSFETFSHKKSVLNKSIAVDPKFIYPPYKNRVKMIRKLY